MSTRVQCPTCGHHAANVVSPTRLWGELYTESELEEACSVSDDDDYELGDDAGRETFECPCGDAIWVGPAGPRNLDRQISREAAGRWFTRDATGRDGTKR